MKNKMSKSQTIFTVFLAVLIVVTAGAASMMVGCNNDKNGSNKETQIVTEIEEYTYIVDKDGNTIAPTDENGNTLNVIIIIPQAPKTALQTVRAILITTTVQVLPRQTTHHQIIQTAAQKLRQTTVQTILRQTKPLQIKLHPAAVQKPRQTAAQAILHQKPALRRVQIRRENRFQLTERSLTWAIP